MDELTAKDETEWPQPLAEQRLVLRLFVTGTTPLSSRAITNVRRFCEEYLEDRYDLEIIDISRETARAFEADIVAAPTLLKVAPQPARRFIGDMSRLEKLLSGMGIACP